MQAADFIQKGCLIDDCGKDLLVDDQKPTKKAEFCQTIKSLQYKHSSTTSCLHTRSHQVG